MNKNYIPLLLFLFLFTVNARSQQFREDFFKTGWIKEAGFKSFDFGTTVFNVQDFGACKDGIFDSTKGIQNAIDACYKAGGGKVVIPKGKYLCGSIFVKSNVHLHLEAESEILGKMDIQGYEVRRTRVEGSEIDWPMGLINVVDAQNVKISGEGIINGRGQAFWKKFWAMEKEYLNNKVRWALDTDCARPRLLLVQNSNNVHLGGLILKDSGFWTVHILYSKYVSVDGLIIRNNDSGERAPSTDGIDIDSSEFVLVQNCDVDCDDDNFCIKSGRNADGMRVNRPSRYIVIQNNVAREGSGLITFGSEISGGISHVYVNNMKADGTKRGIRFKSASVRGGYVKNILLENIDLNNIQWNVFEITMNWNPKSSYPKLPEKYKNQTLLPENWRILLIPVVPAEKGISTIENIFLNNIRVRNGRTAFKVEGFKECPVSNFVFNETRLHTREPGKIKFAANWIINASSFTYENGKLPEITDCDNMDAFTSMMENND
ncbi:glycoside hydrolase family 28 protein [Mariniphaga sediminis]|uniref:glycoside hydrolase family 28 protein n=1 Tax=Mariniphaga sediminis TaxID=1628158 RepID=UPI00356848CD